MSKEVVIANIVKEAERIEEDTEHSAKGHFNASGLWGWCHYALGIPMTLCAVLAGTQSLNDSPGWATGFALTAAALGGLLTFINAEQKSSSHKDSAGRYLALRNNTRTFREIELLQLDAAEATDRIKLLSDERNTLNQSSLSIPRCAWWKAKKDIDTGYSTYRTDIKNSQGENK